MADWTKLEYGSHAARRPDGDTDHVALKYKDVRLNLNPPDVDRLRFFFDCLRNVPDQSFWLDPGQLLCFKMGTHFGLRSGAILFLLTGNDVREIIHLMTKPV